MFSLGSPKSWVGVDLGAGGVKMVELRLEKNRPVLHTYGLTTTPHDIHRVVNRTVKMADNHEPLSAVIKGDVQRGENVSVDKSQVDAYAEIIRAVHSQAKITAKVAIASLPVSAVFHAIVTLPIVKKEEFNRILKAEIKKLLPFPLEEVALDWQVLPADAEAKTQRILVNAVPRALVVFFTQIFKQAGLTLNSLEPESLAVTRALVGRDMATTLLIDMGAERSNFFIVDQGVPVTHNSIEVGGERINQILEKTLGLGDDDVEQVKRDVFNYLLKIGGDERFTKEKVLEMFAPLIDPIMKEIEYGTELFIRQSANLNKRPEKIILSGGAAFFPYLAQHISDRFKVKCFIGDPWGRVVYQDTLKPVLRSIGPRMSVAIGLALRNMV